jgi:hypothetical protein
MISVYGGTGFIGGAFCDLYPDEVIKIPRESRKPESKDILYLISTTSNYNILEDLHVDINTNLNVLMETLQYCKDTDTTINFISTGFVYGLDVIDAKEIDLPQRWHLSDRAREPPNEYGCRASSRSRPVQSEP